MIEVTTDGINAGDLVDVKLSDGSPVTIARVKEVNEEKNEVVLYWHPMNLSIKPHQVIKVHQPVFKVGSTLDRLEYLPLQFSHWLQMDGTFNRDVNAAKPFTDKEEALKAMKEAMDKRSGNLSTPGSPLTCYGVQEFATGKYIKFEEIVIT